MGRIKQRRMQERRQQRDNLKASKQKAVSELIDDIAEYEQFKTEVLKAIRKDLYDGKKHDEIREKYLNIVQARLITKAICDDDSGAITAAKDVLDRAEGKAKERQEVTHKLDQLSEEEIDALLETKLTTVENAEEETEN